MDLFQLEGIIAHAKSVWYDKMVDKKQLKIPEKIDAETCREQISYYQQQLDMITANAEDNMEGQNLNDFNYTEFKYNF